MSELTPEASENSLLITRDPRLGFISAVQTCHAPDMLTAVSAAAPGIAGLPMLLEWNPRKITRGKGGENHGYYVVVGYEGHVDPKDGGESFEMEGTTQENPVETHWNISTLKTVYGPVSKQNGRYIWPETKTDSNTKDSFPNPMFGVSSWMQPGEIWNHNYVSPDLPGSLVSNLGTIVSPPGNPPQVTGRRNWLCIRVRSRQRGNAWQVTVSYQLSDKGGWIPEMYSSNG